MRNLGDTIFHMKANILWDFHICISVPLIWWLLCFCKRVLNSKLADIANTTRKLFSLKENPIILVISKFQRVSIFKLNLKL